MMMLMPVTLSHYLMLAACLFGLGFVGVIMNRKNIITLLMCVELLLLAVNLNWVAFAAFYQQVGAQVFVFFVLTVAAAEAAIGLAIMITLYRTRGTIDVDAMHRLKG